MYFYLNFKASGGLSGGLSSVIAGGDFWKGVREGLITAGLNHAMHSMLDGGGEGDPSKNDKKTKGENINLFDKNNSDVDKNLYNQANFQATEENTLKIFAHGYSDNIDGMLTNEVHEYLLENSELYKYSYENGKKINIEIYACQTGKIMNGTCIALELSNIHKSAIFLAPSENVTYQNGLLGIRTNSYYYNFYNNQISFSTRNYFFSRNWQGENQHREKAHVKF